MRAKLERAPAEPETKRLLLPNLRVEPPHQFTFQTGEPSALASKSCYEDEIVEDRAQRCLRFSVGAQNVGRGPLELEFARLTDVGSEGVMYQRLYYSDGSTARREAGRSEFHKMHRHFYFTRVRAPAAAPVADRSRGALEAAGRGHKSGFCMIDLRIARWRKFDQQRAYSARSDCSPVGDRADMGISAGWTDIYTYDTPGNYVEFGDNPDGHYVVRATVDRTGNVRESSDRDNVGYAYVRVEDGNVTLLERGLDSSPWDRHKVVLTEWWAGGSP